jgi:endo-1,4-beta-xylanase
MKTKSRFLILSVVAIIILGCSAKSAEDSIAAKPGPSAVIDARIAEIRMGDIIVRTKQGANVKVQQVRHEFLFGTAIPNQLAENSPDAMSPENRKMFLKILSENFNYAVHENALKWYDCEKRPGVVDYSVADRIWETCSDYNIPMRGHCIFWEKDKFIMPWLKRLDNDQLRAAVHRRAIDVTEHFKGRINEFDLNNEMVHGDFFRRRLGYGIVNEMAYMAKTGNPDITLFVNDYGILVEAGYNAATYITQIENLLANGVPIGGIGCQGHFVTLKAAGKAPTTPERVQKTLDQLAKFNLPIKITECLFTADDEQGKADALRMFFPVCFAHPSVEAIIMWGFWEQGHWIPDTAMWKKDWTPTPQAEAYRDLVFKKWWTKASGKADETGTFKTRAFYGDYIISSNGQEKKVKLSKKDKSVEVAFD